MYKYTHSHKVDRSGPPNGHHQRPLLQHNRPDVSGPHRPNVHGVNSHEERSLRAFEGKRILVYRNGDQYHKGIILSVSPRQFPTFPSLLQDLNTRQILENKPVNKLYSLDGKHVTSILDLQDGHEYVAATGPFTSIGYGDLSRHHNWTYTRKIQRSEPAPLHRTEREILENPDKVPSRIFRAKPPPMTSLLPTGDDADLESFYRGRNGRFRAGYWDHQGKDKTETKKPEIEQIDVNTIDPFDDKYVKPSGKIIYGVRAGRIVPLGTSGHTTLRSFSPPLPPPPPFAHGRHRRRAVSLNHSNSDDSRGEWRVPPVWSEPHGIQAVSEDSRRYATPTSEPPDLSLSRERFYRDTYSASVWWHQKTKVVRNFSA